MLAMFLAKWGEMYALEFSNSDYSLFIFYILFYFSANSPIFHSFN